MHSLRIYNFLWFTQATKSHNTYSSVGCSLHEKEKEGVNLFLSLLQSTFFPARIHNDIKVDTILPHHVSLTTRAWKKRRMKNTIPFMYYNGSQKIWNISGFLLNFMQYFHCICTWIWRPATLVLLQWWTETDFSFPFCYLCVQAKRDPLIFANFETPNINSWELQMQFWQESSS